MSGFLEWFYAFITTMVNGVWQIISGLFGGLFKIFNVVDYFKQFGAYKGAFKFIDWLFAILSFTPPPWKAGGEWMLFPHWHAPILIVAEWFCKGMCLGSMTSMPRSKIRKNIPIYRSVCAAGMSISLR